jgi:hypothetical protein
MSTAQTLWERSPSLTVLTAVHLVLAAVLLVAMLVDPTPVMGIGRWVKPFKFAVSIAVYVATIAWLLPATGFSARAQAWCAGLVGATMALEMVAIVVQAARTTTSHYNIASAFDGAIFGFMGTLIAINTVTALVMGIGAARVLARDPSAYQLGVALGFAVFLAGSAIGGMMIRNNGHTVGAPDGGAGLPLVNWSTTHGDLRVAHFVGLHALQVLPVLGAVVGRSAVVGTALAWGVVTAALTWQAWRGVPVIGS